MSTPSSSTGTGDCGGSQDDREHLEAEKTAMGLRAISATLEQHYREKAVSAAGTSRMMSERSGWSDAQNEAFDKIPKTDTAGRVRFAMEVLHSQRTERAATASARQRQSDSACETGSAESSRRPRY